METIPDVFTRSSTFAELEEGAAFIFLEFGPGWSIERQIPGVLIKRGQSCQALGGGSWLTLWDGALNQIVVEVHMYNYLKGESEFVIEQGRSLHVFEEKSRTEVRA